MFFGLDLLPVLPAILFNIPYYPADKRIPQKI